MTDWCEVVFGIIRKRGMRQSDIARVVGVKPSAVYGWMNLGRVPRKKNQQVLLSLTGGA